MTEDPRLIIAIAGRPESTIELRDLITIGRSPSNDVFIEDPDASRHHAEIRRRGPYYRLSDLGSVNGTWLNGRRITVPKDLENGDQIRIGKVNLRFAGAAAPELTDSTTLNQSTRRLISNGHVVVLVADIRDYTAMSESLPNRELSRLLSEWYQQASDIIEANRGTVDKFIGDAVMAYWVIPAKSEASDLINRALATSKSLIASARIFAEGVSANFPGYTFRIGVGLNAGDAMVGNVGTGENQSFTVVGDSVNVAFRLESLTKEKKVEVVVSKSITESAGSEHQFEDLGEATVKGRKEPVSVWALCV